MRIAIAWIIALTGLYAGWTLFVWCIQNLDQTAGNVMAALYGACGIALMSFILAAAIGKGSQP